MPSHASHHIHLVAGRRVRAWVIGGHASHTHTCHTSHTHLVVSSLTSLVPELVCVVAGGGCARASGTPTEIGTKLAGVGDGAAIGIGHPGAQFARVRDGVMSCHVMSCQAIPCHVVSCNVVSFCHVRRCRVMWCHVMSPHVMLCYVMPCHVT